MCARVCMHTQDDIAKEVRRLVSYAKAQDKYAAAAAAAGADGMGSGVPGRLSGSSDSLQAR